MQKNNDLKVGITKPKIAWVLVIVFILIDILVISHYALGRYYTYHALAFDLGNMDQAVWNTLHGHFFRFTNRGEDWQGPPIRLAAHIEPILLLITPLYLIHSGPETLLILQTIAIALGAIPLFLLARKELPNMPFVAVAFVAAYLLAPEVIGEGLFDFHPVSLATPLLLYTVWAMITKKYKIFILTAILAAMCKEEVALSVIPLGIYIAFWQNNRKLGIITATLAFFWVIVCFFVIIPHFYGNLIGNYKYRYEWIGDSTSDITNDALRTPLNLIKNINTPLKQKYLTILARTGGGLSIFSPWLLLGAAAEVIINILSNKWEQYIGLYQYNAVIIPFVMSAAIFGTAMFYNIKTQKITINNNKSFARYWKKAIRKIPVPPQIINGLIIFLLAVTTYMNISTVKNGLLLFIKTDNTVRSQQSEINKLLKKIPDSASVATTPTLNAHVSDRYTVLLLPDTQVYNTDYIAIDSNDTLETKKTAVKQMIQKIKSSSRYNVIGSVGGVTVFKHL